MIITFVFYSFVLSGQMRNAAKKKSNEILSLEQTRDQLHVVVVTFHWDE